jgi:hypothetical protein
MSAPFLDRRSRLLATQFGRLDRGRSSLKADVFRREVTKEMAKRMALDG